jgi:hypothetical protein
MHNGLTKVRPDNIAHLHPLKNMCSIQFALSPLCECFLKAFRANFKFGLAVSIRLQLFRFDHDSMFIVFAWSFGARLTYRHTKTHA